MNKYIVLFSLSIVGSMYAKSGFESTQEAMDAIFNTYNTVLQAPDLYDKSVSFNELVQLGDRLNAHIMKKQGVLLGSKTKRNDPLRAFKNSSENIFDLWEDQALYIFTNLMNALKTVRATRSKTTPAAVLINNLQTNGTLDGIISHAKEMRKNTMLNDKKKIADLIIFFTEHTKELVAKAVNDLKNL